MRGLPRLVGGQREQVTPKLPRAKRWAKFHYQAALGLRPPRVRHPCPDANVLAGPHARSLMAAPDNQNTSLNDEPLLLQAVRMHRPAVGAVAASMCIRPTSSVESSSRRIRIPSPSICMPVATART